MGAPKPPQGGGGAKTSTGGGGTGVPPPPLGRALIRIFAFFFPRFFRFLLVAVLFPSAKWFQGGTKRTVFKKKNFACFSSSLF